MSRVDTIFHNDFYNRPVAPAWAWHITFDASSNNVGQDVLGSFSLAASRVEIPPLQMYTTQSQFRGLTFTIPTRLENTGEITVTFHENEYMELYDYLRSYLLETSYNQDYIQDSYSEKDSDRQYMLYYKPFDIYVKLLDFNDTTNKIGYAFVFRNCFILEQTDSDLSYDNTDALVHTVKFHYNFRLEGDSADEFLRKVEENLVTDDKSI